MSALDRIRRVTVLDVRPGDVLLLEVPADTLIEEATDITAAVQTALSDAGHDPSTIGYLMVARGTVEAKVIRA